LNQKTPCLTLIVLIVAATFYSGGLTVEGYVSAPPNSWQNTFGQGPWMTDEKSQAHNLIQTSTGDYALAAGYQGKVYVAKINQAGVMLWTQSFTDGKAVAIAQAEDGFIVAYNSRYGNIGSAVAVLAIDGDGNMLWNRTLMAKDQYMTLSLSSMVKTDGGYVLAGSISNLDSDTLETDFLLIKIGADGQAMWNKTYGGPDFDKASSVIATADGGYAITGFTASFGPHGTNYWLVKTDAEGNMQWSRTYGLDVYGFKSRDGLNEGLAYGAGDNLPKQVIQTADGGYALFGSQGQEINSYYPWLVKTDAYGTVQWNKTYDGGIAPWQYGYSVVQTGDGGYALAATQRQNAMNGPYQTWIIKTDENGSAAWTYNYREYDKVMKYPELVQVTPCTILQTKDNALAFLATVQGYPHTDYFTLIKTVPFLPSTLPQPQNTTFNPDKAPQLKFPTVTIDKTGAVIPSTTAITASGNTYTFNSDFQGNLVVNKANAVIEGNGHTLYGNGTLTQSDGSQTFIQFTMSGVTLNGTSNVEVKNLKLFGFQYQIRLDGTCNNVNIDGNTFSGPFGRAIYCWESQADNLNIFNNNFAHVDGLTLTNMSNSKISGNNFSDSGNIWIVDGSSNRILRNTLRNTQIALRETSPNNLVAANTITNSSTAISSASNSTISYNKISYCTIALNQANNCTIYSNNIEGCRLAFDSSANNQIYQNNIVDCKKLVQGYLSYRTIYPMGNNTWNKDDTGNYWSSYNGTDTNGDGIGDTAFVLDESNTDSYPLVSSVVINVPADLGENGLFGLTSQTLLLIASAVLVAVAVVIIFAAKRKHKPTEI
jgi:nitrous oxidase accessory protein NosD